MTLNVRLLADRVAVIPIKESEQTSGGLVLLSAPTEEPPKGLVVAVGRGSGEKPMEVSVGDTVIYTKFSATSMVIDGHECFVMKESEIIAIV